MVMANIETESIKVPSTKYMAVATITSCTPDRSMLIMNPVIMGASPESTSKRAKTRALARRKSTMTLKETVSLRQLASTPQDCREKPLVAR